MSNHSQEFERVQLLATIVAKLSSHTKAKLNVSLDAIVKESTDRLDVHVKKGGRAQFGDSPCLLEPHRSDRFNMTSAAQNKNSTPALQVTIRPADNCLFEFGKENAYRSKFERAMLNRLSFDLDSVCSGMRYTVERARH